MGSSSKLKSDLLRTYAVNRRKIPLFQDTCPTCISLLGLMQGLALKTRCFHLGNRTNAQCDYLS